MTYWSTLASQQMPEIEVRLSRKDLWRSLFSNGVILWDTGNPQGFWECFIRNFNKNEMSKTKWKKMVRLPKFYRHRQSDKLLSWKYVLLFKQKEKWLPRQSFGKTNRLFPGLETCWSLSRWILKLFGTSDSFLYSIYFFHLGMVLSIIVILCLLYHCI